MRNTGADWAPHLRCVRSYLLRRAVLQAQPKLSELRASISIARVAFTLQAWDATKEDEKALQHLEKSDCAAACHHIGTCDSAGQLCTAVIFAYRAPLQRHLSLAQLEALQRSGSMPETLAAIHLLSVEQNKLLNRYNKYCRISSTEQQVRLCMAQRYQSQDISTTSHPPIKISSMAKTAQRVGGVGLSGVLGKQQIEQILALR